MPPPGDCENLEQLMHITSAGKYPIKAFSNWKCGSKWCIASFEDRLPHAYNSCLGVRQSLEVNVEEVAPDCVDCPNSSSLIAVQRSSMRQCVLLREYCVDESIGDDTQSLVVYGFILKSWLHVRPKKFPFGLVRIL